MLLQFSMIFVRSKVFKFNISAELIILVEKKIILIGYLYLVGKFHLLLLIERLYIMIEILKNGIRQKQT
jgi:hypothetical protein